MVALVMDGETSSKGRVVVEVPDDFLDKQGRVTEKYLPKTESCKETVPGVFVSRNRYHYASFEDWLNICE